MKDGGRIELANEAYHLQVKIIGRDVLLEIQDHKANFNFCSGSYLYQAVCRDGNQRVIFSGLENARFSLSEDRLEIRGEIAGLSLEHSFWLPRARMILEETIRLTNPTDHTIELVDFTCAARCILTNPVGKIRPEVGEDRFQAIPFYRHPTDPTDVDHDYAVSSLLAYAGREPRVNELAAIPEGHGFVPSDRRFSEGWAWQHGSTTLGIFKFNQDYMEFSTLGLEDTSEGVMLRFGGAGMMEDEPSCLRGILPGQKIQLGVTRYETVEGGYVQASSAFRRMLDENGCRFPDHYNPPVHWNELYDNPEWNLGSPGQPPGKRMTRPLAYTRQLLRVEAAKAKDYHCEALYLDPGWDTDFGSFLWGEAWLGDRKTFIEEIWRDYNLRVSLHTPLATWMSWDGRSVDTWPAAAVRMDASGNFVPGSICLGAQQYLDEAEKRLLAHCEDGVVYLMFDGNWWNGGCWNPDHGHPVPYTFESHCRANLDLAQRIHARHPEILIEMHDMIAGGSVLRYTPVYYKYGLPRSYDENWGFELMWQPMEDIRSGRARALYYYNLACNVPAYLHIDLRDDNKNLLVFWWYASTCRHLGIGGTHADPAVAQAHKLAMRHYRSLERFYKRGDFYGISESIHLHALPEENSFVVNLFNLTDEEQIVSGSIAVNEIGLARDVYYIQPAGSGFDSRTGRFHIRRRMEPWSTHLAEVYPLVGRMDNG